MDRLIDIQMPVKKGGFIFGKVIDGFLRQQGVDWKLYVDASDDDDLPEIGDEMLGLIAMSAEADRKKIIEKRLKIAHKRNKMREMLPPYKREDEDSFVYLADADVLLPDDGDIFRSMVDGLNRHPGLGAIGVPYQNSDHVGAGSIMLRRRDFERIGNIGGAGSLCTCGYIYRELLKLGRHTIPLRTVRATHLKSEYDREYSACKDGKEGKYKAECIKLPRSSDGRIQGVFTREKLEECKGEGLKLVFDELIFKLVADKKEAKEEKFS